jgi:hypothetical protein
MNYPKATLIEALETRTLLTTVIGLAPANDLVVFDSGAPEVIVARTAVIMPQGETLIGIDFDHLSQLYGLSNANRIYQIDPETGVATAASAATIPAASGDRLSFDIDLQNPDPQFRAVGKSDRQFTGPFRRPGEVAAVGYAPGDIAAGRSPDLVSLGSTSNGTFPGPTTVYAIDANNDSLVTIGTVGGVQRPANTGRLYTVGSLGIDAGANASLDINNSVGDRAAFASFSTNHGTRFCTIDLATGAANRVGTIGDTTLRVTDIAVYPELSPSSTVLGLTSGNALLAFSSERPEVILGRTAITGLRSDEAMISVDMRPGAGELFGVSSRDVLYQIDPATGAATAIGARFTPFFKGAPVAADFNPIAGTLNVISSLGEALRLDADTGAVVDARPFVRGIQIDAPLAYAAGDTNASATPSIMSIAHDNNYIGAPGSTLFGIDPVTRAVIEFSGSGANLLTTGINLGGLIDDIASLDILSTPGGDFAYLAVRSPSQRPVTLYRMGLQTGTRLALGNIASGNRPVHDIAVVTR